MKFYQKQFEKEAFNIIQEALFAAGIRIAIAVNEDGTPHDPLKESFNNIGKEYMANNGTVAQQEEFVRRGYSILMEGLFMDGIRLKMPELGSRDSSLLIKAILEIGKRYKKLTEAELF